MKIKVLPVDAIVHPDFLDENSDFYDKRTSDRYWFLRFGDLYDVLKNVTGTVMVDNNSVYICYNGIVRYDVLDENAVEMFNFKMNMYNVEEMSVQERNAIKNLPRKFSNAKLNKLKYYIYCWEQINSDKYETKLFTHKFMKGIQQDD